MGWLKMSLSEPQHEKIVLLNTLQSVSTSRAPGDLKAPVHSAEELFGFIVKRCDEKVAVEFTGGLDDPDDQVRIANGKGQSLVNARAHAIRKHDSYTYLVLLLEYADKDERLFPVLDTSTLLGRELSGKHNERGASQAHLVVRLPPTGAKDIGKYRCILELARGLNRHTVETFLSRQVRRHVITDGSFRFEHLTKDKDGKTVEKTYAYTPKLELLADVGRKLNVSKSSGAEISRMEFVKRSEKLSAGVPTDVISENILGDVKITISAGQLSNVHSISDAFKALRKSYEQRGYKTKLYFRHPKTKGEFGGSIEQKVASAADLLLCQREVISLPSEPPAWLGSIYTPTVDAMIQLLGDDKLWDRQPD